MIAWDWFIAGTVLTVLSVAFITVELWNER